MGGLVKVESKEEDKKELVAKEEKWM